MTHFSRHLSSLHHLQQVPQISLTLPAHSPWHGSPQLQQASPENLPASRPAQQVGEPQISLALSFPKNPIPGLTSESVEDHLLWPRFTLHFLSLGTKQIFSTHHPKPIPIPQCQLPKPRKSFYPQSPVVTPNKKAEKFLTEGNTQHRTFPRTREGNKNQATKHPSNTDKTR